VVRNERNRSNRYRAGFDENGVEKYYHGDTDGYVLIHDTGNDFNGSNILARYSTPDYDYGDLGTLKTLHYVRVSCSAEGIVTPALQVKYDFGNTSIPHNHLLILNLAQLIHLQSLQKLFLD
jgi:hypothetical protein